MPIFEQQYDRHRNIAHMHGITHHDEYAQHAVELEVSSRFATSRAMRLQSHLIYKGYHRARQGLKLHAYVLSVSSAEVSE